MVVIDLYMRLIKHTRGLSRLVISRNTTLKAKGGEAIERKLKRPPLN